MILVILYWVLLVIGFCGSAYSSRGNYPALGNSFIVLILFIIIGMKVPALKPF